LERSFSHGRPYSLRTVSHGDAHSPAQQHHAMSDLLKAVAELKQLTARYKGILGAIVFFILLSIGFDIAILLVLIFGG